MAKIKVTNPKQIINGGAKKYYFKVKGVGGIKGDKGDKGDTGSQGPQGPQGNAATIEVGSTTTLPTGYDATVTNTGTINNAILNFGIPRGIKGDTGAKGDKGDKGDKGEQGNTGPQGPAGQNATVYVGTTTTGAPGTQASVYNSGTDRNAVLNFTIPQGATGATGATGPQGPAGQDGQNFTPTIVETLPTTGDQSKLYLTPKDYTTGTATGNPITISLGEDAGQITSFQLDGDTYQQSYTGKNLFNKNNYSDQTGYYIGGNGIWRSGGVNDHYFVFDIEPNTTYTFSKNAQASNNRFRVGISSGEPTVGVAFPIWGGGDTATEITLTTASDSKYAYVYYSVTTNVEEAIQSLQIELGSTATSYEPYVGGTYSPNPDYPQQIQTVTGRQVVKVEGKNLYNKDLPLSKTYYTNTGATATYAKDQFINFTIVPTSDKITMSYSGIHNQQHGSSILAYVRLVQYDSNGQFISRLMSNTNNYTFDISSSTAKIIVCIDAGEDAYFDDLQLEYGNQATDYLPYQSGDYEINLGKNLYNSRIVQGYYAFANGNYSPNSSSYVTSEDKIPVEAGQTYTISANKGVYDGSNYTGAGVVFFNNGTFVSSILRPENGTFTVPSGANQVIYNFYKGSSDSSITPNDIAWVQLELGSTASSYAPYFTPIELCKLGTYQDYIYKDGDDWKEHKATALATLTGSNEDWRKSGNSSNVSFYYASNINTGRFKFSDIDTSALGNGTSSTVVPPILTNNFGVVYPANIFTDRQAVSINNNSGGVVELRLGMGLDTTITTATLLTSWLATNNINVYYPLATQTDTTITDQTLIAQLEAVRNATLQASNTITNTATGSNLAGDMELGYCEYDPTNRYDKWLWLDLNNNYEKLGS